jgi:peptidoglycan/xylan/chitin deacetylase (PgdA/CDA1 family)
VCSSDLTFDDAFHDFYTNAWPILNEHGFHASVFAPTFFIDNPMQELLKGNKHLSWDEMRWLASKGIEIGSHTINHKMLWTCPREVIRTEIVDSKKIIRDRIGIDPVSFSYPFATPTDDKKLLEFIGQCIAEAGYRFAVGTTIGVSKRNSIGVFHNRLPVNSEDDEQLLQAKLDGDYDWLRPVQEKVKHIKRILGLKPKKRISFK